MMGKSKIPEHCENKWCENEIARDSDGKPLEPLRDGDGYPIFLCHNCRDLVSMFIYGGEID